MKWGQFNPKNACSTRDGYYFCMQLCTGLGQIDKMYSIVLNSLLISFYNCLIGSVKIKKLHLQLIFHFAKQGISSAYLSV